MLVILLPNDTDISANSLERLKSLPYTLIKTVPQMGNPDLSTYLGIISVWSLIQFDFVINLNQRSVVLDGLQLLSMLTPLYMLLDNINLAAPSNADYPDMF